MSVANFVHIVITPNLSNFQPILKILVLFNEECNSSDQVRKLSITDQGYGSYSRNKCFLDNKVTNSCSQRILYIPHSPHKNSIGYVQNPFSSVSVAFRLQTH